jgi:hypothetical protein
MRTCLDKILLLVLLVLLLVLVFPPHTELVES